MRTSPIILTIFGLLVLWCPPVKGQTESAETMLHEGILRYKVGKFTQSAKILKRALHKATDPLVKAKIHLYLGLNQGVDGDAARSEKAFREALTLDPTLVLEKSSTKESILKIFMRARASLTGELSVSADRPGAALYIDDKRRGTVPFKGPVVVGKHVLEVSLPDGLHGYKGEVLIRAGQAHSMQVMLKPLTGTLQVDSKPPGAAVEVDGKARGKTPLDALNLKPGKHAVRLSLKGHKEATRQVELEAGKVAKVQLELAKLPNLLPSPVLRPIAPSTKKRGRLWTYVAAGSAVALAGVGMGFGLWAKSGWDEYQEVASTDRERYDLLRDSVPMRATVSSVTFATAGALAITAVVLFFVEPRGEAQPTRASVTPDGVVFGYQF